MLILLIVNFLVRSGRLDKVILVVRHAYKRGGARVARTALLLMLMLFAAPQSFSNNSALAANYRHVAEALPVPKGINNMLFYLQRDPDANTVVYQLNIKNGELNADDPVNAFWVKYADKGQVKQLSALQRRLAYGLRAKALGNGRHELRFVSYPKLPLYLVKEGSDYNVLTKVDQRNLILNHIFVRVKEGTLNFPKVEYVELIGTDAESGRALIHRINI